MSYVLKVQNIDATVGEEVALDVPRYQGANPSAGDEAFVWWSESSGGDGLAYRGKIKSVKPIGRALRVSLLIEEAVSSSLRTADLARYRDARDGAPLSGISAKLYRHSPNKVAALSPEEAALLGRRFSGPATNEEKSAGGRAQKHAQGVLPYNSLKAQLIKRGFVSSSTTKLIRFEHANAMHPIYLKLPEKSHQQVRRPFVVHPEIERAHPGILDIPGLLRDDKYYHLAWKFTGQYRLLS